VAVKKPIHACQAAVCPNPTAPLIGKYQEDEKGRREPGIGSRRRASTSPLPGRRLPGNNRVKFALEILSGSEGFISMRG
jgi:hypothetical protein